VHYDAFISYSHAGDGKLAPAVQRSLHRFAKPLFSRRALRVFRDQSSLAVTPDLWQSIAKALASSDYFILLASPESAQSHWVQQEITRWLEENPPDKLFLVLTDGTIAWDDQAGDFDWTRTTALPKVLERVFSQEPLYVDLTWARSTEHMSLRHPDFRSAIARLAATLHDRPLDEISGEDVRQHRRFVRFVTAGIVTLAVAAVVAIVSAYLADRNRRQAIRQRYVSISQALAAYSERELEQSHQDERAALLARQAYLFNERYQANRLEQIDKALRSVLGKPYPSIVLTRTERNLKLSTIALSHDGKYLAAGGEGQFLHLWDLSQRPLRPVELKTGENLIWTLAFANHSPILIAGTHDGRVKVWHLAETGEVTEAVTIETGLAQRIDSLSISADDQWLAVGGEDGRLYLWSLTQPDYQTAQICCHDGAVTSVLFHPTEARLLASGGADKSVYLWTIVQREEALVRYPNHDNRIQSLAFSQDGRWLAAGTEFSRIAASLKDSILEQGEDFTFQEIGGTIWLRDITRTEEPPRILRSGGTTSVTTLAFGENDSRLAANGANNDLILWQWQETGSPATRLPGHRAHVRELAYSGTGTVLGSLDETSTIRLWDTRPPMAAPRVFEDHEDAVTGIAFDATSKQLASVSGWGAYLWDIATQNLAKIEMEDSTSFLSVTFHPRHSWLMVGSGGSMLDVDNTVRIWRLPDVAQPNETLEGATSGLTSIAISRDGARLAVAGRFDKQVLIWNLDAIKQPPQIAAFDQDVTALAFADGNDLFVAVSDRVHRLAINGGDTAAQRVIENQGSRINTLAFDPNEQRLATGAEDGSFRLWQITGPRKAAKLQRSLKYQALYSVAFGPEGKEVAAAGEGGEVRLWNLERDNADAQVFDGPGRNVYSVAFSADGNWLAAGGSDNTVRLWPRTKWLAELSCRNVTRNLSRREWDEYVGVDIAYEVTCEDLPPPVGEEAY